MSALREELEELADRFPVEKAVLFGSYATGDFTAAEYARRRRHFDRMTEGGIVVFGADD